MDALKRRRAARIGLLLCTAAALVSLHRFGLLDPLEWVRASARLAKFFGLMFPPSWSELSILSGAMAETVEIAFLGTLLGFCLSMPLAFLANRVLFPAAVTTPVRLLLDGIRTVPSILWGVLFVVAFGLGPAAGVLGVALYGVGYLGKLYYEAFEAVDREVVEAVRGVGCNRLQLFFHAVLPETANAVLSQLLFMFEYNIRASAILGFVGAGGIGYYMLGYTQMLQYRNLLTALLLTFGVVMAVDALSVRLRARLAA